MDWTKTGWTKTGRTHLLVDKNAANFAQLLNAFHLLVQYAISKNKGTNDGLNHAAQKKEDHFSNYTFPIDLAPNGGPSGAKSMEKGNCNQNLF